MFNIPGIGRYAYEAIATRDLPMIQGTVLFGAFFIIVANIVVDVAYAFLDPRVRYCRERAAARGPRPARALRDRRRRRAGRRRRLATPSSAARRSASSASRARARASRA